MGHIVWVLGAGFSKPLGGPLLADLFTPASEGALKVRYSLRDYSHLYGPTPTFLRWLYRYGLKPSRDTPHVAVEENTSGEWLWENAEEFLEYVDTATHGEANSPERRRLEALIESYRSLGGRDPVIQRDTIGTRSHIAATARRLLAAECSAFLRDVRDKSLHSEKWIPYETWWQRLTPDRKHTIITFNYDLVIERLALSIPKLAVVEPSGVAAAPLNSIPLLKLHGSVDWKRVAVTGGPVQYRTGQSDDFAVTCDDNELAIATPGLTKRAMVGGFGALWQQAEAELIAADAIVFVGYRFPPTDSEALSRLLGAIGRNQKLYLALHTVLGPKKSDDIARLHSLLHYAAREQRREHTSVVGMEAVRGLGEAGRRAYTLVPQALYSQDFLLVAQMHQIEQPYLIRWD